LELKHLNLLLVSRAELKSINLKNSSVVHATNTSYPDKNARLSEVTISLNDCYINWQDLHDEKAFTVESFQKAFDFIDEKRKGSLVIVYCDYAQSRSPSLFMAFLSKKTNFLPDNFYEAVDKFKELYPSYHYPTGISNFLKHNWLKLS
jgi:hypothetical protein